MPPRKLQRSNPYGELLQRKTATLPEHIIRQIKRHGNGNFSAGVRRLAEERWPGKKRGE